MLLSARCVIFVACGSSKADIVKASILLNYCLYYIYTVSQKTSNSLYTCPPHLYTVATLPWEIQKVIFLQYYSYILQIIYVISEETNC